MTSLTRYFPPLKCQMIVYPSSLHSCVLGTNFSPTERPGEIMSFGVSSLNYPGTCANIAEHSDRVKKFGKYGVVWIIYRALRFVFIVLKPKNIRKIIINFQLLFQCRIAKILSEFLVNSACMLFIIINLIIA